MAEKKPRHPLPMLLRRLLRRTLSHSVYRRYVGRHEDGSMAFWRQFVLKVPSGTAIVDIGAFHGGYSLAAKEVNPTARVFAFEPNPVNLQILHAVCDPIGVAICPVAVAETNEIVQFLCASQESRITTAAESDHCLQDDVHHVPAVSLDSWASDNAVAPSLIKMDTEGAEAGILRGSKRVLLAYQPTILCEVLSDSAGAEIMAALPSFYRFWSVNENRAEVEEHSQITRLSWRNKNWLLLPGGRPSQIRTAPVPPSRVGSCTRRT